MKHTPLIGAAILVILVAATACPHDPNDYIGNPSEFIVLEVEGGATTIPADGFTETRITATLVANDPIAAEVQFATTRGAFVGVKVTDGKATVRVDQDKTASILLRSGTESGEGTVSATVVDNEKVHRGLTLSFVPPDPDDVMRFVAAPGNAPADGATRSLFVTEVSGAITDRTVAFSTTAGKFPDGKLTASIPADTNNQAAVELVSATTVLSGVVSATINGVTRTASISFDRALPDQILALPDALEVEAGKTLNVNGTLLRNAGTVTPQTIATFDTQRPDGSSLGGFLSIQPSNLQGQVSATYLPGDTAYRGPVTIIIGVIGSPVTGSTTIQLIEPK